MKKFITIIFFILFWISFQNVVLACEYQSEIDQCIAANRESWAWSRSITAFVCANTYWNNTEKIAYQVIFDMKFREIDKDIENYLKTLQNSIQYYYWPDKKESFLDWINYINEIFNPNWTLAIRYKKFCEPSNVTSIINNFYKCIGWDNSKKSSTISESNFYFSKWTCNDLVEYKLYIYKKVAYNLLQINKLDFLKEFRKKQLKSTRTIYDKIIWNMYNNLDYITRINSGWDNSTKQCQYIATDS